MLLFLDRLPTFVLMLLGVLLAVLFSVGGVYVVRRLVPSEMRKEHNDVAGYIYAMLGVVYAVLLAFVVFVVWQQYQNVSTAVDNEANAVIVLYRVAQALPEPNRNQVTDQLRQYARAVIDDEWTHLGKYEQIVPPETELTRLWTTGTAFDPKTTRESDLYTQILTGMEEINTLRRQRFEADRTHIPGVLWALLIGSGIIIVVFTFFFGARSQYLHSLMAGALAAVITFTLLLILVLDHPFVGSVRIGPEAFRAALTLMGK